MKFDKTLAKQIGFAVLFVVAAFITQKINFSRIVGAENQTFTVFQFFGPISGGFLGPVMGVAVVLFSQVVNFIAFQQVNMLNFLLLFPMLFAAYYFGTKKRGFEIVVPAVAMLLFITNPVAGGAWYYSLFWLIPIIVKFLPDRLIFRSLGATFTAHAVGTVIWLYSVPMTAQQWTMLVPVTAYERGLFALGIAASYIIVNTLLDAMTSRIDLRLVNVDPRYVAFKGLRLL